MDRLMQTVVREDEFDSDMTSTLSTCLCQILVSQFNNNIFPQDVDDELVIFV